MNFENFTIKSQESVNEAIQIAKNNNNQAIETGHIFKGILRTDENVTSFLLKKSDVNVNNLETVLNKIIESYPKVSGGKEYFSNNAFISSFIS